MRKQELVARGRQRDQESREPRSDRRYRGLRHDRAGALADGDEVAISGFGSFKVTDRPARTVAIRRPARRSRSEPRRARPSRPAPV